jgi:hypothetical protein
MTTLATRLLTFGGMTVLVEHTQGRAAGIVDYVFARLPRPAGSTAPQVALRLSEEVDTGVFTLSSGGEVCCVDDSEGTIASWLLHVACRQLATGQAPGLLVHGALVHQGSRGLLLAGASGSGKTTLTAFLTAKGFGHLTDELAYVRPGSMRIEGLAGPLKLKKSGVGPLEDHLSLSASDARVREGRHDVLVSCHSPRPAGSSVTLTAIVFPSYRPRAPFRLEALSPAQTGLRLMPCVVNAASLPDHGFREVARIAGRVRAYDLRYSSLEQIEAHLTRIRSLTSPPGGMPATRRARKHTRKKEEQHGSRDARRHTPSRRRRSTVR